MSRRAARTDSNHAEIRDAIRAAGFFCHDCSSYGGGFPDLLCVNRYGQVILFEVKSPGGRLTEAERDFHATYPGLLYIVRSAEMAIEYLRMRWE